MYDNQTKFSKIMYIAGVIGLIGLFLPSGFNYMTVESYYYFDIYWLFGLLFYSYTIPGGGETDLIMFRDSEILLPGIFSFALILIASVVMIYAATKLKKGGIDLERAYKLASRATGVFFFAGIIYLIWMHYGWYILTAVSFWFNTSYPFLSIYTTFLSGIIGIYIAFQISKAKAIYESQQKRYPPLQAISSPENIPPLPNARYCIECGRPIPSGAQFCSNCGKPVYR